MHLYRKVHKSKWTIGKKVYPDQEFLAIKASCEEAVRLIEKKTPHCPKFARIKGIR